VPTTRLLNSTAEWHLDFVVKVKVHGDAWLRMSRTGSYSFEVTSRTRTKNLNTTH